MHDSLGRSSFPLYAQVLVAVLCGATLGVLFGEESYLGGLRNEQLGQLGLWVVWVLKSLAVPLIFVAILDSLIRTSLPLGQGVKLLVICLVNVTVAMIIGLTIMNPLIIKVFDVPVGLTVLNAGLILDRLLHHRVESRVQQALHK